MKIPPDRSMDRITSGTRDRLELEKMEFHRRVYEGYMELEKLYPARITGIDAGRSIEEIKEEIHKHLERLLEKYESSESS